MWGIGLKKMAVIVIKHVLILTNQRIRLLSCWGLFRSEEWIINLLVLFIIVS